MNIIITRILLEQKNKLLEELNTKEKFRLIKQKTNEINNNQIKGKDEVSENARTKDRRDRDRISEIGSLFDSATTNIINFCENYDNYVGMLNTVNYDGTNSNQFRNSWLFDLDKPELYTGYSRAINDISDLVLPCLKALEPNYDINVRIPDYFYNIPNFNYKDLGFSKFTNSFQQPKLRYIQTSSFKQLDQYLRDEDLKLRIRRYRLALSRLDNVATDEDLCNYGYAQMVVNLGLQPRYLDCCSQIASMLALKQRRSYYESHGHIENDTDKLYKRGIDLVGIYAIKKLLEHHTLMPFIETNYRYFPRVTEIDCVANLPQFIYALLQISLLEFTNVYNKDDAELAVEYLFKNSEYSLCQGYLDSRGRLRDIEMHLMMKLHCIRSIDRTKSAKPVSSEIIENFVDFNYDKLVETLPELEKKMDDLDKRIYNRLNTKINKAEKMNNPDKVLHQVVHCRMLLYAITCPSIYNKTSLKLEYEKSAKPVIKEGMNYPPVTERMVLSDGSTIPISWDWEKSNLVFRDIQQEFDEMYKKELISYLKKIDFEARYADVMTNRSEGVKTISDDIPEALQKISNTRTISLALNPDDMNVFDRFLEKLRTGGKCTIRFQIDRRARVVVMVIKQKQSQQIINLEGFNKLKKFCESIDVGRQKGDIRNCSFQLYASSGLRGLCNSSDMKGQDAHTLPITTDFINDLYMQCVRENRKDKMFFSNEAEHDILIENENRIIKERLSGIFKLGVHVMRNDKPTQYSLEDKFFTFQNNDPFIVSDFTFPSGLYGTTAQHTTLLALDHDSSVKVWNEVHGTDQKIVSTGRFVGDDKFQLLSGKKEVIEDFLEFAQLRYKIMNFESEVTYSYIFATFLQNDCICGVYAPKPHRMSVFTEEKGEVHRRERTSVIQNIISTCRILGQRTFSPDNISVIIFQIWNLLRIYNYNVSKYYMDKLEHPFVNKIGNNLIRIELPIWSYYEAPLFGPVPSLLSKKHNIKVKAVDMTYGSGNSQRLHIINSLRDNQIPSTINQTLRITPTGNKLWLYGKASDIPIQYWTLVELMIERKDMIVLKDLLINLKSDEYVIISEIEKSILSRVPNLSSKGFEIRGQGYEYLSDLNDLEESIWLLRQSAWFMNKQQENSFSNDKLQMRLLHIGNGVFIITDHEREFLNIEVGTRLGLHNNFTNVKSITAIVTEIIIDKELSYIKVDVNMVNCIGISSLLMRRKDNGITQDYFVQLQDDDTLITKTSINGENTNLGFFGACTGIYLNYGDGISTIVGMHWAGDKYNVNIGVNQKLIDNIGITTPLIYVPDKLEKLDTKLIYRYNKKRNLSSWLKTPLEEIPSEKLEFLHVTEIYEFLNFSRDNKLSKERIEEIDEYRFQKLVNFYRQYQDVKTDKRSRLAKKWFEEQGIEGGQGLAYYNKPRKKIEDSLIARDQDLTERKVIDSSFLLSMMSTMKRIKLSLTYKHSLPKIIKDQINTFCIELLPSGEIEPHPDIETLGITRSLPGYGPYESFGAMYYAVGGIANSTYLSASEYRHLLNDFDVSGGLENVLKEAQRLVGKSRNRDEGIEHFCDLIAIPRERRQALRSLILEEIRTYHDVEYTTFYENQVFFDVNTNPNMLTRVIDESKTLLVQGFSNIIRAINDFGSVIRDLFTIKSFKYKKYVVKIHPYSYIRYVLSRKINPSDFKYVRELLN